MDTIEINAKSLEAVVEFIENNEERFPEAVQNMVVEGSDAFGRTRVDVTFVTYELTFKVDPDNFEVALGG